MGTKKILLVEDEPVIGLDIKKTLLDLGYEVPDIILSGEEALRDIEDLNPDLILMDIRLSGAMDGIETVKQIQQKFDKPIIYLSAHTEHETFERARETKPYGYLMKPIGQNDLYSAIETALHRHDLEAKIMESEQKYHNIFDNAGDMIIVHDFKGIILDVNGVASERLGYSKDELLAMTPQDIDSQESAALVRQRIDQIQKTGKVFFETTHIAKNGTRIPTEVSSKVIEFDGKKAILSIARDITERKNAQATLEKSEDLLNSILRASAVGIAHAQDRKIIWANEMMEKLFGFTSKDQYMGADTRILYVSDEEYLRVGRLVYQSPPGVLFETDSRFRRSDGTEWDGHVMINIMDPADPKKGIIVNILDITDWKQAEEALRESEDLLNRSQAISHVGSWELDLEINRLKWSDEVYRIFGIRPQEFDATYEAFLDTVHPEDRQAVDATYFESMQEGRNSYEIEHRIIRQDNGDVRTVHEKCEHIKDASGRIVRSIGMVQDITERKAAERQIEASLREKETLLKEIHHRVKNNFQIITSLLSLQERTIENEELRLLLREPKNRIRAMSLIHDRLYHSDDLSRIDFADYLRGITREIFNTYYRDSNRVKLKIDADRIYLDIQHAIPCGLIVNELVSNSIKYAFPPDEKKKGTIVVSMHEAKGACELLVSDNGIGIPENIDIDNTRTLGLRLVHMLVKNQLKGTYELSRKTGTEYTIHFNKGTF